MGSSRFNRILTGLYFFSPVGVRPIYPVPKGGQDIPQKFPGQPGGNTSFPWVSKGWNELLREGKSFSTPIPSRGIHTHRTISGPKRLIFGPETNYNNEHNSHFWSRSLAASWWCTSEWRHHLPRNFWVLLWKVLACIFVLLLSPPNSNFGYF